MRNRSRLDSVARRPQTASAAPPVFLTIEDDRAGQVMADVVRIVFEELRESPQSDDGDIR
jgi:hypothetical protein